MHFVDSPSKPMARKIPVQRKLATDRCGNCWLHRGIEFVGIYWVCNVGLWHLIVGYYSSKEVGRNKCIVKRRSAAARGPGDKQKTVHIRASFGSAPRFVACRLAAYADRERAKRSFAVVRDVLVVGADPIERPD